MTELTSSKSPASHIAFPTRDETTRSAGWLGNPDRFVRSACIVLAISLAMRLLVLICFWPAWIWRTGLVHDDWNRLAINWVDFGTFGYAANEPTTQRAPLFVIFEVPLYLLFGENYAAWSITLLFFDVCTTLLLILLGRRLWGNRTALLAGLFHAVSLPVIYYSANIEQFTTTLPFVFLWVYVISACDSHTSNMRHYAILGLLSGILILGKSVYLLVVIGAAAALFWFNRKRIASTVTVRQLAVMLLLAAIVVAPWTYRNYLVTGGRLIPVQSYFWGVLWQKFVISDLDAREGWNRPDGRTLQYILARQKDLYASGNPDYAAQLPPAQRELYYEQLYKRQVLEWAASDPTAPVRYVLSNLWQFWFRAENLRKTLLMAAIQAPLLIAALLAFTFVIRYRQFARVRFAVVLILILWGEHSLVFGWGRYSLDTVPALALIFGTGIDAWLRNRPRPIGAHLWRLGTAS